MQTDLVLHTAPIGPLLSPFQLRGGRIVYNPVKGFRHETALGIVKDVSVSKSCGTLVYVKPDDGSYPRWIALYQVRGWAWWDVGSDDEPARAAEMAMATA